MKRFILKAVALAIGCLLIGAAAWALFSGLHSPVRGAWETNAPEFEVTCPSCGKLNTINSGVPGVTHCRKCGITVDCWVASEHGEMHRPPWFLQGFLPAGLAAKTRPLNAEAALIEAWMLAQSRVAMIDVSSGGSVFERIWQRPVTSWNSRQGRSHDRCLLIVDMFRSLGFEARMACGSARESIRAWVVVKLDGREYILEPAFSENPTRFPPTVEFLRSQYHPELAFDEGAVYYPLDPGSNPSSYWDGGEWITMQFENL